MKLKNHLKGERRTKVNCIIFISHSWMTELITQLTANGTPKAPGLCRERKSWQTGGHANELEILGSTLISMFSSKSITNRLSRRSIRSATDRKTIESVFFCSIAFGNFKWFLANWFASKLVYMPFALINRYWRQNWWQKWRDSWAFNVSFASEISVLSTSYWLDRPLHNIIGRCSWRQSRANRLDNVNFNRAKFQITES